MADLEKIAPAEIATGAGAIEMTLMANRNVSYRP